MFYNIVRERIYEGAVSRLLFQLEAEDLVQKSTVSMQPYGADDGADIAFHTADGCTIFRGYFHVKPFGNVNEQFRIGNSADDTINCIAEPHVGVVDAEAPKQVSLSYFMMIPPDIFDSCKVKPGMGVFSS